MAIRDLAPLAGTWDTRIKMLHPPGMAGQTADAVDGYRWLPGEQVLVHDIDAVMGGETVGSVEIFTAASDGSLRSCSYDGTGEVSDFDVTLRDGALTLRGETQRFEGRFETPTRLSGLWRLREGNDWIDWMRVTLTKRG